MNLIAAERSAGESRNLTEVFLLLRTNAQQLQPSRSNRSGRYVVEGYRLLQLYQIRHSKYFTLVFHA